MKTQALKEKYYTPEMYDNDSAFRGMIQTRLDPDHCVLDAGAGAGELFSYTFKEQVAEMVGIDLDSRVEQNPQLHRGVVSDLTKTPFEDESFDVVFSRYVLEHIQKPAAFLAEMGRILKPGGTFLFLTPNKWHYVALASRLTPNAFHEWYNRKRGRAEDDTFPTVYRLNSRADVRRAFQRAGFREDELIMRECCPNYLLVSKWLFYPGVLYERVVNRCKIFASFRVNLLGSFVKEGKREP